MELMDREEFVFELSKISWERVFLSLEIQTNYTGEAKFYLVHVDKLDLKKKVNVRTVKELERFEIKPEKFEDQKYSFCYSVAALHGRTFLNNGTWKIVVEVEGREQLCYITNEVAYQFPELSRIFRYGRDKYAYTISFDVATEYNKYLVPLIVSQFMMQNNGWTRRHYVQEALTLKGKFKRIYMSMAVWSIKTYYKLLSSLHHYDGKNVLFMSETKDVLWGNLKYLDQNLKDRGLDKEYKISYSFRKAVGSHSSILSWVKTVSMLASQDYIFVDDYVPIFGFLDPNPKTKLIQVWHAGEGFKAVGYCRFGKDGSPFPVGSCHKKYDYVLTASDKLVKVFAEVFGIENEAFLPVGMARLDGFLDPQVIADFKEKFYAEYPQIKDKKVILFAPTYRGDGQKDANYDYEWIDLPQIYEYCQKTDSVFLVKMHPFVRENLEIPEEYQDRIMDFKSFPNINDLYYITDLLITDYSSNYYEYALMKRPVLFFTPAREYYELSRGVHRSVKECAPGKICDSFDEMMEALYKEDYEFEKIEQFVKDNFGSYDGKASEKAIDIILKPETHA